MSVRERQAPGLAADILEERSCPACGLQFGDASRFCAHCGAVRSVRQYRVLRVLGQNDFRRTYLAVDPDGEQVTLKELVFTRAPSIEQVDSFEREAGLLEQLRHPRAPERVDAFREGQGRETRFYIAYRYIPGITLAQKIAEAPLSEEEALRIAREVLGVLREMHGRKPPVFHRDLKPSNLVMGDDGKLYLVDFGSARQVEHAVTHDATLVGTFGYMPPQQLAGTVDATTDL